MTVYAFDLDGTLDKPSIAQLANDLYDAGHEVHIVTGALADIGEWTMASRIAKLSRLGVKYTSIQRAIHPNPSEIGRVKGEICNQLGAIIIFDDNQDFMDGIGQASAVQRLKVI